MILFYINLLFQVFIESNCLKIKMKNKIINDIQDLNIEVNIIIYEFR